MMLNVHSYRALTLTLGVLAWLSSALLYAEEPKEPPDLTQTQDVNRDKTYNLGATGLRGWIFTGQRISLRVSKGAPPPRAGRFWSRTWVQTRRPTA